MHRIHLVMLKAWPLVCHFKGLPDSPLPPPGSGKAPKGCDWFDWLPSMSECHLIQETMVGFSAKHSRGEFNEPEYHSVSCNNVASVLLRLAGAYT